MIITIDGPTASGKSTVAQALAHELGFVHLNSGLLYRALAYVLVQKFGYDAETLAHPQQADLDAVVTSGRLRYEYKDGNAKVFFDGVDITPHLKTKEIDYYSSLSSAVPAVRASLLSLQRQVGELHDVVAEGRDVGTKVFPNATLKIFLTAGLAVRAERWRAFQKEKRKCYTQAEAEEIVDARDQRDRERAIAPLQQAPGAVVIDSTYKTINEVISEILQLKSLRN